MKLVRFNAVNDVHSVATFIALLSVLFVFYAMASRIIRDLKWSTPRALTVILIGALCFRITLLFAGIPPDVGWRQAGARVQADLCGDAVTFDSYLLFDNDIWRYLWDGHVAANGFSPYLFEPRNPKLDSLTADTAGSPFWGDIRANVNHSDTPTIYPPFAQLVFRVGYAIAPGSVLVMKLVLIACDLLTILLLAIILRALSQPVTEVILYAWNPLVIKAVAGSGHMDAILAMSLAAMIYFVVRGWHTAAAVSWGLAILAKLSPIVLLPFLIRRVGWRKCSIGLAVVLLGYMPYWDQQGTSLAGLKVFASEWQFNSGSTRFIEWLVEPFSDNPVLLAKVAGGLTFLALLMWLVHSDDAKDKTLPFYGVSALGGLLVLSPTVMPWYLVGLLPLAVIARTYSWVQFSLLVCLAFIVMIDGTERTWVLWIEFGILAVLLWREFARRGAQLRGRGRDASPLTAGGTR